MLADKAGIKTIYILAGFFAALLLAGIFLRHTLSALLTALVLAYLLNPILKWLEKRGFDRITAIVMIYGFGVFVVLLIVVFLIPYINHQFNSLIKSLPVYLQHMKGAIRELQMRLAPHYQGGEGEWLAARAEESLQRLTQELSGQGYERLKGLAFGMFNLVLAPILVFFMLLYKEYFKSNLMRTLPYSEKDHLAAMGNRINRTLERFIIAMVLDCLLVGILSGTALALLNIEFPLLNGLFAGFASIIPILGVMVAIIPPTLLGYAQSGDLMVIPKVCAAYFIIHIIIEANLIKPLIMKSTLKLNPLTVIFALMAMGELLGFWGIILAIPVAAVIKICANEVRDLLHEDGVL